MHLIDYLKNPPAIGRRLVWRWYTWTGRPGRLTAATWNGRLTFDRTDQLIGKRLFVARAYERPLIERAIQTLQTAGWLGDHRSLALDIGANIGMIAIALIRHGWFEEVVAVEPVPANLELLHHNIRQNDLADRIHVHEVALAARRGTLDMALDPINSGGHRVLPEGQGATRTDVIDVPVRRLDDLIESGAVDWERVGLVWLDIEGREPAFFAGAACLRRAPVPVVMELSPAFLRIGGDDLPAFFGTLDQTFGTFVELDQEDGSPQPMKALLERYEQLRIQGGVRAVNVLMLPRRP